MSLPLELGLGFGATPSSSGGGVRLLLILHSGITPGVAWEIMWDAMEQIWIKCTLPAVLLFQALKLRFGDPL